MVSSPFRPAVDEGADVVFCLFVGGDRVVSASSPPRESDSESTCFGGERGRGPCVFGSAASFPGFLLVTS
jgi:hypothetical protein